MISTEAMPAMISTEAMPAIVQDVGVGRHDAVRMDHVVRLVSRLLLALVLAALAVLIPGEADRFLDAPLDWTGLRSILPRDAPANAVAHGFT